MLFVFLVCLLYVSRFGFLCFHCLRERRRRIFQMFFCLPPIFLIWRNSSLEGEEIKQRTWGGGKKSFFLLFYWPTISINMTTYVRVASLGQFQKPNSSFYLVETSKFALNQQPWCLHLWNALNVPNLTTFSPSFFFICECHYIRLERGK